MEKVTFELSLKGEVECWQMGKIEKGYFIFRNQHKKQRYGGVPWFKGTPEELRGNSCDHRWIMSWEDGSWQKMKLEQSWDSITKNLHAMYDRDTHHSASTGFLPTLPSLLAWGGSHMASFTNGL